MILVIDNYDSFTYNLVQYLGELGADVRVRRNNAVTIEEIETMAPDQIVISPGPGRPENAGITPEVIRRFGPTIPILGVCLGHQAIGMVYGGTVTRARTPMHGKTSTVVHDSKGVFAGISAPFYADPDIRKQRGGRVPLQRLGAAEDIAAAVLFLASDDASYINGHQLVVDGGVVHSLLAQMPLPAATTR